ncbi:hypothetical protein [Sphingomonas bacterium]|uniref:hypothetical protein n=1 Tax=Sphingomonas bacterium TaxID=1895847 RepID=UPI002611E21F|nr:hypothetical protein [Sphingomonas bacterium]MDB5679373.1 hypothetical protein [Sphingomonas bacterium]
MIAFRKWGLIHRPVSVIGWVITIAAIAFMVQVFLAIDARSHSNTDTLYGIYPFWGVTFLGWEWLARRLSSD